MDALRLSGEDAVVETIRKTKQNAAGHFLLLLLVPFYSINLTLPHTHRQCNWKIPKLNKFDEQL